MVSRAATEAQASRLSQLLRHWVKALSARSGWPKWNVDAISPPTAKR